MTTTATALAVVPDVGSCEELGAPQAEAAVLGALMSTSPAHARTVLESLTEGDWTVPHHATVAAAVDTLLQAGEPVDPVTVLGQLRRDGLDRAHAANRSAGVMLLDLLAACPSASSAGYYARIVREHTYRRRVQQSAVRLLQVAATGALPDLDELLSHEQVDLETIRRRLATG